MTFKELVKKVDRIQNMLLDDYKSPETFLNANLELSDLRVYLLHPDIFIDDYNKGE